MALCEASRAFVELKRAPEQAANLLKKVIKEHGQGLRARWHTVAAGGDQVGRKDSAKMQSAKCKMQSVLRIRRVLRLCILIFALCTLHYFAFQGLRGDPLLSGPAGAESQLTWCLVRVEKVDKERNMIIYGEVGLEGRAPDRCDQAQPPRRISSSRMATIMNAAGAARPACSSTTAAASETCIPNYWYQAASGGT